MTYEEFLRTIGQSYANRFSPESINAAYDPYFNQQLGAEEYQRGLAQQDLAQTQQDTAKQYGEAFSNRGLFGSGIYQTELNRQLSDLGQGFERQYGVGQYTPYSLRKAQIEEQRRVAKAEARLSRENQAWNAYSQQYYPTTV